MSGKVISLYAHREQRDIVMAFTQEHGVRLTLGESCTLYTLDHEHGPFTVAQIAELHRGVLEVVACVKAMKPA